MGLLARDLRCGSPPLCVDSSLFTKRHDECRNMLFGIDLLKYQFAPDVKASIKDVDRTRSVTSEHLEAFYFSTALMPGRSLALVVLCPLEQVEHLLTESSFSFEPMVFGRFASPPIRNARKSHTLPSFGFPFLSYFSKQKASNDHRVI